MLCKGICTCTSKLQIIILFNKFNICEYSIYLYNYMYATHFKRSLVTIPEKTDKPISALQNTKIHCTTTHWFEIIRNLQDGE